MFSSKVALEVAEADLDKARLVAGKVVDKGALVLGPRITIIAATSIEFLHHRQGTGHWKLYQRVVGQAKT